MLRNGIFFTAWGLFTVLFCSYILLIVPIYPRLIRVVHTQWGNVSLWLLRIVCGVKSRIVGRTPTEGCAHVVLSNHQSTFETIFFLLLFPKQTWLLKKQILNIPFFGWAIRLFHPIAIDRGARSASMKKLLREGTTRLVEGQWLVIFPEGTRTPFGTRNTLHRGGARLAAAAHVPVVCVAHDAGKVWPRGGYIRPGTVTFHISDPLATTDSTVIQEYFLTHLRQHAIGYAEAA